MTDPNRPLILITNDDGIQSPGLIAAATAAAPLGDLLIVAPHEQKTGAGRSFAAIEDTKIYTHQLQIAGQSVTAYSLKATPAQAVNTALLDLAPRPISLAISGINFGENIGSGVTISGTVGAAIEAAVAGIPSIAVSLEVPGVEYHNSYSTDIDFTVAGHFTGYFAQKLLSHKLPFDVDVLKIEVPASATTETPWRVTSVSRKPYHFGLPAGPEKRGKIVETGYITRYEQQNLEPDSDIWAVCIDKVVAVSPLTFDLTSRVSLARLQNLLNGADK